MQKHLLDAAAEETHGVTESYREGQGLMAGAKVAELARRGIEAFVESEKKFLDLAAHELQIKHLKSKAEKLGYRVTPIPAAA